MELENLYTRRLKRILQSKYLFKLICFICIIISLLLEFYLPLKTKYNIEDNRISGQILDYKFDDKKLKLTIKGKEKLVAYYYFKDVQERTFYEEKIELGMTLDLSGNLKLPTNNTIDNAFNYKKYLNHQRINYYMLVDNINIVSNNKSVFYFLKNKLIERIDEIDQMGYMRTFIIGDKTILNNEITESYQKNGISHLFSISGMHVSLIVSMLMFFLNKVSYNNFLKNGIVIFFLIFYLFLTGCGSSILRTVIMFIVFTLNKILNLNIKRLDLMLLVLIIAIIIKPLIIFDMGFQFSYSISFALVMCYKKVSNYKKKWQKNLITSFLSFFISFPICIYYYSEINFLSILLNLVFIPLVSLIIFPLILLTFIIPCIQPILEILVTALEKTSMFMNNITFLNFTFSKPSILIITLYYIIIFLSFSKPKNLLFLGLLIVIHKNFLYLDNSIKVTMLDIGQGDSILIKFPHNKGNLLIDTGGIVTFSKKNESYLAEEKIIPYLKTLGINELNYLIVTHGDYDHMGEAINLVDNFNVENVIFNCGPYNDLEQELIKVLDKKKIKYYSCIKELNIGDNKLYFLNDKDYGNENDNSSVIYTKLNNYKFLFMGDAGVEVEEDLIEKYNLQNIDVLKVGHHGSRTSSSKEFIDVINPKYSIISVGKNNRYGHPNDSVLENLNNSKIYRTDQEGSIMFKIKSNKIAVETCSP